MAGWLLSGVLPLVAIVAALLLKSFYVAPYLIVSERLAAIESKLVPLAASVERQPDTPKLPMSEFEGSVIRNRERVIRANVQLLLNQLADARRTIKQAIADERFWEDAVPTTIWWNVHNELAPEKGFHVAYGFTREAVAAIEQANTRALSDHPDSYSAADVPMLEEVDRKANYAEVALTRFLGEMAS